MEQRRTYTSRATGAAFRSAAQSRTPLNDDSQRPMQSLAKAGKGKGAEEGIKVAIYHLSAQIIGRGAGRSAVASAAYRHCAKMERAETGDEIDYSRKSGNAHSEFALPENAPSWIADFADAHSSHETSAFFWNAVEEFEVRSDAQFMREIVLALPTELTTEQNIELVRDFVDREFSAHGIVSDWTYHDMEDNPHIHLMTSLRPLTEDGLGAKRVALLDEDGEPLRGKNGKIRYEQFAGGLERLRQVREAWADIQNHHLTKHGHDIRVDHRSFEELGIDAVPSVHRGIAADNMDARGEASEIAEKARHVSRDNYERYAEEPELVLQKITIQKAVFSMHDIAREIHKTECSAEEFQTLFLRVGASEELVPIAVPSFDAFTGEQTSEAQYSTKCMVELEHNMVRNIETIAAKPGVQVAEKKLENTFDAFEQKRGFSLNGQQKMVVKHLTSDHSAAALVGYAGVGKSTAIDAARMALEGDGYKVIGGALAGISADNLRAESGVESRTLASWEYQWGKGDLLPDNKTVFIMDEAGMVSSSQMERISNQLKEAGARMIVLGDARQLQPIQAGAAFRAFVDVTGYVELDSVVRQSEPWMREAAIAFGSGNAEAGVKAYIEHEKVAWSETNEDARSALIEDWMPRHQAAADTTIMAHRNKDVIALNMEAREALKKIDALVEEQPFLTERGERNFSEGDRVLFLKNERSLGVFNGTSGTVQKAEQNRLEVLVDGHADPIVIRAHEYNNLDYGYARTIHKEQGNTVDQSFVYLSPTMDAQLSYVALTRHRDDVKLYASQEDCSNEKQLVDRMSWDRLQDTTVLYRDRVDYKDVVQGFAERRGFPTTENMVEFVKSNVAYLRERFDKLAEAFDRLRKRVPDIELRSSTKGRELDEIKRPVQTDIVLQPPPEVSQRLHQSMSRLSHNLASEHMQGRKARGFERSAHYELNIASSADELRGFNDTIRTQLAGDTVVKHGSHQPAENASILKNMTPEWQSFARENWDAIFAAQWAETQVALKPLNETMKPKLPVPDVSGPNIEGKSTMPDLPEDIKTKPLIDAVPNIPPMEDKEVRSRAIVDQGLEYSTAVARDVAGRIYTDRQAAIDTILERYAETGNAKAIISEVERGPASFGEVKGATLFGLANSERRNALEITYQLAVKTEGLFEQVGKTEQEIVHAHDARRAAMAKPLPDLSKDTQIFIDRVQQVADLPRGEAKIDQMKTLLSDEKPLQELQKFRDSLSERYGRGQARIREGLSSEPSLKNKSEPERQATITRVNSVLTAVPVIVQMQDQVKQHERTRDLGKNHSRGIER